MKVKLYIAISFCWIFLGCLPASNFSSSIGEFVSFLAQKKTSSVNTGTDTTSGAIASINGTIYKKTLSGSSTITSLISAGTLYALKQTSISTSTSTSASTSTYITVPILSSQFEISLLLGQYSFSVADSSGTSLGTFSINISDNKTLPTPTSVSDGISLNISSIGSSANTSTGTATSTSTSSASTSTSTLACSNSTNTYKSLQYRVLDAKYDSANDRIILIESSENKLHIYNPETDSDTPIALNSAPLNVAISLDGTKAAVGHDVKVSLVNLSNSSIQEITTNVKSADITMSNSYVYVSPLTSGAIKCIKISDGTVTDQTGITFYSPNSRIVVEPTLTYMYLIDIGISPVDIFKLNISGGTASYLYDSSYHGNYDMCAPIWVTKDSSRILTACKNTFSVSVAQSSDIIYNGQFTQVDGIQYASSSASKIVLIPLSTSTSSTNDDTKYVHVYQTSNLSLVSRNILPCATNGALKYKVAGQFVFVNNAGNKFYAIMRPDSSSNLLVDGITSSSF